MSRLPQNWNWYTGMRSLSRFIAARGNDFVWRNYNGVVTTRVGVKLREYGLR